MAKKNEEPFHGGSTLKNSFAELPLRALQKGRLINFQFNVPWNGSCSYVGSAEGHEFSAKLQAMAELEQLILGAESIIN